jgi:hypothetical protein
MKCIVLAILALGALAGCGGDGNTTLPDSPPDIAGFWNGTETVVERGGTECHEAVQSGTRTGDIFNVTQNGERIVILQLGNCAICRFTGSISANGAFTASGTIPPATLRVEGQVSGKSMTATKRPIGIDCDRTSEYELTRRE